MRPSRRSVLKAMLAGATAPAIAAAGSPLILLAPEGRPYNYYEDGVLRGMFVDLVREAFRRAQLDIEIRLLPWARCMEEVRWGRADGYYVVYRTPERETLYDFSHEPLEVLSETIYIRSQYGFDPRGEVASLRGKRIGVLEYSTHGDKIRRAVENGVISPLISVNGYENLALMLDSGRIDVVLAVKDAMNETIQALQLEDRIRQVSPELDLIPAFLAFTRRRDLSAQRNAYDQALRSMKPDGTYQRLVRDNQLAVLTN